MKREPLQVALTHVRYDNDDDPDSALNFGIVRMKRSLNSSGQFSTTYS